jgi:hypothetical protein
LYFISKKITDTSNIKFILKRTPHKIDKKLSGAYNTYVKNSRGNTTSFYSPSGETLLVIPRKGYINLMDFTFNASDKEWVDLWKRVAKEFTKKKFNYISTHGHGVNWLHIRLEKNIKYH